ncbi:hypothetical protein HNY73_001462 [Argiope bruennichi]|uniref:Uncharacterized protein n=1 Tax=Argiope bruennichi TaxID=94029 RepID=A0A8T0G3X6_ARGBR|nr:hypothetical protein HNY73_001462 [Argiope bruennichi]
MTSKSKIIKAIQNFSNVCKEILRIEERIKNAVENADSSDALFNVLKTKVNTYEQKLENSFSNLDVNDSEEKLEKYLEFQNVLFECAVLLENTKPKNKTESQADSSNVKIQASKKLPKLELPHFYGDMENWISFKELFQATGNSNHPLYKCPVFNRMKIEERLKAIEGICCRNCLRKNHKTDNCKINIGCKVCKNRHHTLLHKYNVNLPTETGSNPDVVAVSNGVSNSSVLLSTAVIKVKDHSGKFVKCRALIDNASQLSLISKKLAHQLNLPLKNTNHKLTGINGINAETSLHSCQVEFTPHFSSKTFNLNALVVNKVTSLLPNFDIQIQHWPHLDNLILADPNFYISQQIDILLGADIYALLLDGLPIFGPSGTPAAISTKLGYILTGKIYTSQMPDSIVHSTFCDQLNKFWSIEKFPPNVPVEKIYDPCQEFYQQSVCRNDEGRFIVSLPFKEDKTLGESKEKAIHLFFTLENRLNRNPPLKEKFNKFMKEYLSLGHMKAISIDREKESPNCYIPYHMIQNDNSSTTKCRVVFNASAKTSNGKSLNNILLIGPKLQTDIFSHLVKFRSYRVAFSADIEKMYRQILIADDDLKYQRIVWRSTPSDPLISYELQTVTYGTSCAPFLALRTLQQLYLEEEQTFPIATRYAKNHFYVDDLLAGADTEEEAKAIIAEIQNLMKSGGFSLRKWSSSHKIILKDLDKSLLATESMHSLDDEEVKQRVLGIFWNLLTDSIQVRIADGEIVNTKRQLLSVIAKTFDPLGLFSPSVIILKIMLQELWKSKAAWDDPVPLTILETWTKFKQQSYNLNLISVPRFLGVDNNSDIQLHGFCDASTKAFAAVVYLKSRQNQVSLVSAKTRVAPIKQLTIPRLELCGALLLAELITAIEKALSFPIKERYLWTDSTIVLSWINRPPSKGNIFIQNRVNNILNLTSVSDWYHIPGKLNPADCATRGLFPEQLKNASYWWNGPDWIKQDFHPLVPSLKVLTTNLDEPDSVQEPTSVNADRNPLNDMLLKFSSYTKLIRVFAWVKRFIQNCKATCLTSKSVGLLQAEEVEASLKNLVKLIQQAEFYQEIKCFKLNKPIPKSSKLLPLNIILDKDGILRVGGRLSKLPTLPYDQKFPIIIPKRHHITPLIIRHFHQLSLHAGPELVLSLIRQKFWIPDGRSTVRREIKRCIACCRLNSKPSNPKMGDLPSSRITKSRPFEKVGVDFAGPWKSLLQLKHQFWNRWTRDVLHHLQARRKWHQHRPPLSVGDLVLIQADNMPPLSWPLARILEILLGTDGIPRVALLRTPSGPAKRAINRLIALPVPTCRAPEDGDSSERQQMAQ